MQNVLSIITNEPYAGMPIGFEKQDTT